MKLRKRILIITLVALLVIAASVALSACGKLDMYECIYENSDLYTVADHGEVEMTVMSDLDIKWYNGTVTVQKSDEVSVVTFYEENTGDVKADADETMHYYYDGMKLNIRYGKSGRIKFRPRGIVKHLYVFVPSTLTLQEVEIEAISADITVTDISANDVSVESVSGKAHVECTAREVEVETTSGDVYVNCAASEIEVETVSGGVTLTCATLPRKMEIDTTSGSVQMYLTNERAFSVVYDTVSGSYVNEFENLVQYKNSGRSVFDYLGGVQPNAAYYYVVDTTSGNLRIEQLVKE